MANKQIIPFFIFISTLISCSNIQEKQGNKIHSKKEKLTSHSNWLTEQSANYSILYPNNWTIHKSGQLGTIFFLSSPLTSEEDDFSENISLIIQDIKGQNMTLNKFVDISEQQINTLITDASIDVSMRINTPKYTFHKLLYSGKQGILALVFEQYYILTKDNAYVLTFTCKKDTYAKYSTIGEEILNSFQLKLEA